MPVYRGRRKGTWRVCVWARGRQHEWIVEATKSDAEAYEAKKRLELQVVEISKQRGVPRFRTFVDDKYRAHAEQHLEKSTWENRVYYLQTLTEFFGDDRLTEIDTERVEDYKRWRHGKVKPISINSELIVLQAVRAYARKLGYAVALCEVIRLPVAEAGRVRVWTEQQARHLLAVAREEDPDLYPLVGFLLNTGCRKGECIAAERTWWDREAGLIRIPVTEYWRPKSKRPREVPVSSSLDQVLREMPAHDTWLFPSLLGGRFAYFPDKQFQHVREAAGLVGGPHTCRHTFASLFLRACPDLFLLAKVMGHSTLKVTELYSHLLPDHLERARNAVDLT